MKKQNIVESKKQEDLKQFPRKKEFWINICKDLNAFDNVTPRSGYRLKSI